jgi:hypothetical protein
MEETMGAIMIGYVIFSVGITVVMSYTLQTIADKNDLSEIARFLCWVPILNTWPMLQACGASLKEFLLVMVGLVAAAVAAGVTSSAIGGTVGVAIAFCFGIGAGLYALYYFGKLCWVLAERRDLSGWIGLLMFVPIINIGVFAYIAFYDGLSPINKAGCAVGVLLAVGSSMGNYQLQSLFEENGQAFEMALQEAAEGDPQMMAALEQAAKQAANDDTIAVEDGSMPAMESGSVGDMPLQAPDSEMDQTRNAIRAMMVMGERFDAIKALDPGDAAQAAQMRAMLDSTRSELAGMQHALGDEAAQQFRVELDQLEARLETGDPVPARMADSSSAISAGRCPTGTRQMGNTPPQGYSAWCERSGGVKHGWSASWYENGELESKGTYADGLRVGVWRRYFQDGSTKVEAEFHEGKQNGLMRVFDASGRMMRATRFRDGQPAPS